jgi:hypothetical protein
MFIEET